MTFPLVPRDFPRFNSQWLMQRNDPGTMKGESGLSSQIDCWIN